MAGASLDSLADKFHVSRDSIHRHMQKHVTDDDRSHILADLPLQELLERAADEGVSLIDHCRIIRATLMRSFTAAASVGDRNGTAALAGRLNEVLGLMGKLTGEMLSLAPGASITNNTQILINSPVFADLQAMLVQTLSPYPEALAAVVEGLQQLEAKAAPAPKNAPLIEAKPLESAHV
jgi:hypothetical protein